jgi:serine/threonine-protein kinase
MISASVRIDPGSSIGPYVVERRLAQGGMSVLFVARDRVSGHQVVIKIVADELPRSAARARLMREARALASLDHPGIVRVLGTGEHEGTPWVAMEYVRGIDLKRLVAERGPVPVHKALAYLVQASEALVAAHDAGVIHRDLKPSNLLLTPEGAIKIVDFGIAKRRADAGGDVLTSQREMLGTPAYLSPEQLEYGLADERSDVWALGCVLYELVVGVPPFGKGGTASTMAAILRDEPAFPPHVDGAVALVIAACLRKSSLSRIASPRELLVLLRDALDNPESQLAATAPSTRSSPPPSGGASPHPRVSEMVAARTSTVSQLPPRIRDSVPPPGTRSSSSMRVAVPARIGRIKGAAVRAGLLWYTKQYGAENSALLFTIASPDLKAMLRPEDSAFGVIASGWYDTHYIGELLELMQHLADPPDFDEYANALTVAIAHDNASGVYKALFRLISSPTMLEANAQRVWRTYVDEGTLVARIPSPGQIESVVRGWSRHHPIVCRTVASMMQNLLRELGYTGCIFERTQCVSEGDPACAFDGMWLP